MQARAVGADSEEARDMLDYEIVEVAPVEEVELTADPPGSQLAGEPMTFTAVVTEGNQDAEFRFYYRIPGKSWKSATSYSTDNSWTVSTSYVGEVQIGVLARAVGSGVSEQARAMIDYEIVEEIPSEKGPHFSVHLRYNELWGDDWAEVTWPEGTELTITIGDLNNPDYTKVVYTGENGRFYDWPEYEIETGDVVTVSDGTITRTHQVEYLNITAVDFDNNHVEGEATPNKEVQVIWFNTYEEEHYSEIVISDANGDWEMDLSGIYDIDSESNVHARINDNQGNTTLDHWQQRQGRVGVNPVRNILYIYDWLPHEEVAVTIVGGDGYNRTIEANRYGNFTIELDGIFDIEAGYEITATQGAVTATYTVS